ncbi:fimbrial protein [Cronobacter turicensis]
MLLLLFMLPCFSSFAGSCWRNSGAASNYETFYPSSIVVQRDAAVGTIVYQSTAYPYGNIVYTCEASPPYQFKPLRGTDTGVRIYNNFSVYSTNVPGIGFTATCNTFNNPCVTSNINLSTFPSYGIVNTSGASMVDTMPRSFALVVTGPVSPGVINAGDYVELNEGGYPVNKINLGSSVSVSVQQCSITTNNLVFPIGDIPVSQFSDSVGFIPTGAQNTQNLGLNCSSSANVNVTFQGTQNPDVSTNSILALTGQGSAGVAKGVGVQILYNGSPLELNKRMVLKNSANGQQTFPLTARYYQTKTSVMAGTANASATLSLTYQ